MRHDRVPGEDAVLLDVPERPVQASVSEAKAAR
jgi:hypothetical protein